MSRLSFHNTSTRACTLEGYPGVSYVDASGHQIGAAAQRDTSLGYGPRAVTLSSGASAIALFQVKTAVPQARPSCRSTSASGLRVYPPGNTASIVVHPQASHKPLTCANPAIATASIGPVMAPNHVSS